MEPFDVKKLNLQQSIEISIEKNTYFLYQKNTLKDLRSTILL